MSELEKYQGIYSDPVRSRRYGHSNHGAKAVKPLMKWAPASVLDVGCGFNEFVKNLRTLLPTVRSVGVDFACPGADIQASATQMPFDAREFDVLTAFDLLEHLPPEDVENALHEMARVSRRFIFSISYQPSVNKWKGQTLHPTVRPEEWWLEQLARAGAMAIEKWGRYITGYWRPGSRTQLASTFRGSGVEVGAATGHFSSVILQVSRCTRLWSIDRWTDDRGLKEYMEVAQLLARAGRGRCIPLRTSFAEAAPLFPDNSLDFVFLNINAGNVLEKGETLEKWWPKLKCGGTLAGDGYHPERQPIVDLVKAFSAARGVATQVTDGSDSDFPSWWITKNASPGPPPLTAPLAVYFEPAHIHFDSPVEPGESVILVGNGPSMLLRGDRGSTIDRFDQVVRFNWFAIRGFEAQVGTKTTLWSTFGRGSVPRDEDQRRSAPCIFMAKTKRG
jgi:SAM-dependent methyltransferase